MENKNIVVVETKISIKIDRRKLKDEEFNRALETGIKEMVRAGEIKADNPAVIKD